MEKRVEILNQLYNSQDENGRLTKSRHGQLEYMTTMHFIHQYLKPESKVIEIGAGTGRYSVKLGKEGYDVTALELVEANLEVMKKNIGYLKNVKALQGDALDLSRFEDKSFDVTLLLGPMYHLFSLEDQHKALDEAIRVTKTGGVILVAFLSVHAVLYSNFLKGNFEAGLKINLDEKYKPTHFEKQVFTAFEVSDFEALFEGKSVEHITTAGTDSILEMAEGRTDFKMGDHDFNQFFKYHLSCCERRELLAASNHLLYVCKKNR